MLNLLTSAQMREADRSTMEKKGLAAEELMERAAMAFTAGFISEYPDKEKKICIYCGTGNNGGDGLAIGRLLKKEGYESVEIKIARFNSRISPEFSINLERARKTGLPLTDIESGQSVSEDAEILVDALLGSGLNRPLTGRWKKLVAGINSLNKLVVGVDVPTGFTAEGPFDPREPVLQCGTVFTFQLPKINFFFPESARALDRFKVVDIGLDEAFIASQPGFFRLVAREDIREILKPRKEFTHKGSYGHTLILAGKEETMGAAILCAGASVYAGSGLTSAALPLERFAGMNTAYPEVMVIARKKRGRKNKGLLADTTYTAVVAGPGLGTGTAAAKLLGELIKKGQAGMVLDADALTVLANHPALLASLEGGTVLTPHMKEFDRLFGDHENWWARLTTARQQAQLHNIVIVLKNRYTFIITPDKQVLVNPTGGPSMATGGMGDVLAGIIGALISQGYTGREAAVAGVYIHGTCGERDGGYVTPASELIRLIPGVMKEFFDG